MREFSVDMARPVLENFCSDSAVRFEMFEKFFLAVQEYCKTWNQPKVFSILKNLDEGRTHFDIAVGATNFRLQMFDSWKGNYNALGIMALKESVINPRTFEAMRAVKISDKGNVFIQIPDGEQEEELLRIDFNRDISLTWHRHLGILIFLIYAELQPKS